MPDAAGLHYEWYGDEGLPPLVLVSGLAGLGSWWEPNLLALAEEYRVLVYDQRGCGASGADGTGDVTAHAYDLVSLLDALELDEKPGLIGHGLGGLIGLQLAIDHPDRLLRMMAVNAWAELDSYTARVFDTLGALLRAGLRDYVRGLPLFLYPPTWLAEHDADLLRAEPDALDALPPPGMIEARFHAARRFDPGAYRLGTITCPVMCLASEDDAFVPAHGSEKLAALIPGATFASFAAGGHGVNVTRLDDFNARVVDWSR